VPVDDPLQGPPPPAEAVGQPQTPPPAAPAPGGGDEGWRAVAAAEATKAHLRQALAVLSALPPADAEAARAAAAAILAAAKTQDAFLHAAGHDLRNPLAAIRGQVQLLQRRSRRFDLPPADAERLARGLAAVDAAVGRTTALVDRLLDATWRDGELGDDPPASSP